VSGWLPVPRYRSGISFLAILSCGHQRESRILPSGLRTNCLTCTYHKDVTDILILTPGEVR
jgi:hypothetical protein